MTTHQDRSPSTSSRCRVKLQWHLSQARGQPWWGPETWILPRHCSYRVSKTPHLGTQRNIQGSITASDAYSKIVCGSVTSQGNSSFILTWLQWKTGWKLFHEPHQCWSRAPQPPLKNQEYNALKPDPSCSHRWWTTWSHRIFWKISPCARDEKSTIEVLYITVIHVFCSPVSNHCTRKSCYASRTSRMSLSYRKTHALWLTAVCPLRSEPCACAPPKQGKQMHVTISCKFGEVVGIRKPRNESDGIRERTVVYTSHRIVLFRYWEIKKSMKHGWRYNFFQVQMSQTVGAGW